MAKVEFFRKPPSPEASALMNFLLDIASSTAKAADMADPVKRIQLIDDAALDPATKATLKAAQVNQADLRKTLDFDTQSSSIELSSIKITE
jgi:hypothetical protein